MIIERVFIGRNSAFLRSSGESDIFQCLNIWQLPVFVFNGLCLLQWNNKSLDIIRGCLKSMEFLVMTSDNVWKERLSRNSCWMFQLISLLLAKALLVNKRRTKLQKVLFPPQYRRICDSSVRNFRYQSTCCTRSSTINVVISSLCINP